MSLNHEAMPRKKRILSSLVLGFGAEIVNKISPLFVLSMAQKRLGLESFGSAIFAISMIEVTLPIIIFGYTYHGALTLPKLRNDAEAQGELISEILILRIFHAFLAMAGLALATQFIASWREHADVILKLLPFLLISAFDVTYVNIGVQRMGRLSLWVGAFKLVTLGLVAAFVHNPSDADLFAIFMLISGAGVSISSAAWVLPRLKLRRPAFGKGLNLAKGVMGFAAVVFLYPLFERFDLLVVERYLTPELLGTYTAPWRLVMSIVPLFMVVASTFLAENVAHKSEEELTRGADQALFLSLALTVPIAFAAPFVSGDILSLVFEETLRSSDKLFSLFTFSILAQVFVTIWGLQVLLLKRRLRYLTGSLLVGVIGGALLTYLFQRSFGAMGGAFGALLGRWLTVFIIALPLLPLIRSLKGWNYFKILVAALLMALTLYALPSDWSVFVKIPLGGMVYLIAMAGLNRREILGFLKRT